MKLTENFTLDELTATSTGINNKPMPTELDNLKLLCINILQPLRDWYSDAITVNSGYRNPAVNLKVKGATNSDHLKGMAADITAGNKAENEKLFNWIRDNCKYRQLINEYDYKWIHVSYNVKDNKKQVLIIK